ncbi:MAG: RDD family protein [Verrucomicrobiota bacterium]
MSDQYYLFINGEQQGPFTHPQVMAKIDAGEMKATDLAWKEGDADWTPLSDYTDFSQGAMTRVEKTPEIDLGSIKLAQPMTRLIAVVIDLVLFSIVMLPLALAGGGNDAEALKIPVLLSLFLFLALVGVQVWQLSSRSQTLGKRFLKIHIADKEGKRADLGRTLVLRQIIPNIIFSIPILGLIFFLVDAAFIFRENRRCIHDLIAGTIVLEGEPTAFDSSQKI